MVQHVAAEDDVEGGTGEVGDRARVAPDQGRHRGLARLGARLVRSLSVVAEQRELRGGVREDDGRGAETRGDDSEHARARAELDDALPLESTPDRGRTATPPP